MNMFGFQALVLSVLAFVMTDGVQLLNRKPRSVIQLGQVMECATQNHKPFGVLDVYNCYGCYCGKGGDGTPVDAIDRCCYSHDQCYGNLEKEGTCNQLLGDVYFQPYEFDCVARTIEDHRTSEQHTTYWPQCKKASTKCGEGVCNCDVQFANCIRHFKVETKKKCGTFRLCL